MSALYGVEDDSGMHYYGSNCTITSSSISCPYSGGSSIGSHTFYVGGQDIAGNEFQVNTGFTVFDDKPSIITYTVPPGGVFDSSNPTIAGTFDDPAPFSGGVQAVATLNNDPSISAPCSVGNGTFSCNAYGLADGHYSVAFSLTDGSGNTGTAAGSFDVATCQGGRPDLSVGSPDPRWATYADFQDRNLTVGYRVANNSAVSAHNVRLLASVNNSSVNLVTAVPYSVGDVPGTSWAPATLVYHVPDGVSVFTASLSASAWNDAASDCRYP